jgi:hypothetical protein
MKGLLNDLEFNDVLLKLTGYVLLINNFADIWTILLSLNFLFWIFFSMVRVPRPKKHFNAGLRSSSQQLVFALRVFKRRAIIKIPTVENRHCRFHHFTSSGLRSFHIATLDSGVGFEIILK